MPLPSIGGSPTGFANGLYVRGVPLLSAYTGNIFWVDSQTGSDSAGSADYSFQRPGATLDSAINRCVEDRGDIIVLKPGHAETVTSATQINMDVSGVAVVGLGTGTARPTFTLTTVNTATIPVSAANCSFTNCVFVAGFLSIARAMTLTTAKFFTLQNCAFTDTAAATDFLQCVVSTGAANTVDGLVVTDCKWFGTGVTSVVSFCTIAAANDGVTFLRNRFITERTADQAIALTVTTGASTNIEFGDNVVVSKQTASTNGTLAKLNASSTGSAYRNFSGTLVTASDILFTTTVGIFPFENRVSGVVGKTGFEIPAVDA